MFRITSGWRPIAALLVCVSIAPAHSSTGILVLSNDPRFDGDWIGNSVVDLGGKLAIQDGELRSVELYAPPLTIEYRVKSDGGNARFGFGCDQVLFDWESNPTQLRIDGGPASGRHIHGKGRLPTDRFVTITQTLSADRLDVLVDGEPRGRWFADFSKIRQPIRVWTVDWATLIVESIRIRRDGAPVTANTSAPPPSHTTETTPPRGYVAKNERFDDDFLAVRGAFENGALMMRDGMVASLGSHAPPIAISYRLATDSEVRLGYGASEIIFNWPPNPEELRVGLGPATNQHLAGKGKIETGKFTTIRQVVTTDGMTIEVDGELRGEWKADFRDYRSPIEVFSHDALIRVESIRIATP